MTLQYRIRSKYQDQTWRQRIYLCERLLTDAFDLWCRSDGEFAADRTVAAALFIFSPRCDPYEESAYRIFERLAGVVGTAEEEYRHTWPKHEELQIVDLISVLTAAVVETVEAWRDDRGNGLSCDELAECFAHEMVALQYVVFHHCETTRRDLNHWGI